MRQQDRPRGPRHIVIIGSGFSGVCLGIRLKRAGIHHFTILEKAERVGGTWRDNVYPGAACDTPSFSYCYSFEPNPDWSRKWAGQEEILAYLEHCVRKYDLTPHIRLGTAVERARFHEQEGQWHVHTAGGDELVADVLVSGVGQLNRPAYPDIPGLADFGGEAFHSAQWNHDCDLAGKRVAVIGNAASAIQFIPQIAPRTADLRVFQRSANWMLPKNDYAYPAWAKALFRRVPSVARLYRSYIWLQHELRFPAFRGNRLMGALATRRAERHIREQVSDPALRRALLPDYPLGGKRILLSDDYYPTLERPNVHLITEPIDRVTHDAVVTADGTTHPADVLIFATGFQSTSFLAPMRIEGRDGRSLDAAWRDGAEAYLGLAVAGFPNFFMMYGPNTNLGHNSILFMIECQVRYILDCLRRMKERDLRSIDVRPEAQSAYNERLQRELAQTVWARTGHSWYKTAGGRITNNWSGTTAAYWWRTRRADLRHYRCEAHAGAGADRSPAG